jgi:exopolysaccharide production protein ExoQ
VTDTFPRTALLSLGALWVLALIVAWSLGDTMSAGVLLAIPLGVLGIIIVYEALNERPWAVAVIAFAAIFMLDATFRIREYTDKSLDAQILGKLATWALILGLSLFQIGRYMRTAFDGASILWLILYAWLAVTCLWAPSPMYSIVAVASMIIFHLFVMYLVTRFREESIAGLFMFTILVFCAISIVVYIVFPDFGRMYEWVGDVRIPRNRMRGISPSANAVGSMAGVGILLASIYWDRIRPRWFMLTIVVVCGLALVLSQSRTTMATVAIVLLAFHWGTFRRIPFMMIGIALGVMIFLFLLPYFEDLLVFLSRSGNASEITTGTNRVAIWQAVLQIWSEQPVQGWGFGSTLFILPTYSGLFSAAAHAHNNLLEILVTSGVIGLSLMIFALFATISAALQTRCYRGLTLLLFVLLRGTSEATPFGGVASSMFVLFTFSIGLICMAKRREVSRLSQVQNQSYAAMLQTRPAR